jgi:hypothetical protein
MFRDVVARRDVEHQLLESREVRRQRVQFIRVDVAERDDGQLFTR